MIRFSGNVITGVVDQASNGFGATGVENGVLIAEAMICGGYSVVSCIYIVVRDTHRGCLSKFMIAPANRTKFNRVTLFGGC